MGALSKIDEILLSPQVRTFSVAVPGSSRNNNSENLETTGDHSLDNPYLGMWYFSHHSDQLNSPESENKPHMVTRATEELRQYPHMMTSTQEVIPYCSSTTSSGKQKKARSTSQPQFRNENTPVTIEADQILLAASTIGDELQFSQFQ